MEVCYFILGMIWALWFFPMFSAFTDWMYAAVEYKKTKLGVKIYKLNKEIEDSEASKQELQPAIGFQVAPEDFYEEDE
jgi:hypothetical protein